MKYFSFLLDTIRWDNQVLKKQFAKQFQWCLFYNVCLNSKQIHAFAVSCNHRGCKPKAGPAAEWALFRNIHTKHNDWFTTTVEIIAELSSSCQKELKSKTNKETECNTHNARYSLAPIHSELQNQLNYRTAQNTQSEIKENHLQRATGAKKKNYCACFCS